jgi:hydroxypyruvate isomerase
VLLEPSRSPGEGDTDYPLQTVRDAENIISAVPGTALLADFWHLAETEGAEGAGGIRGGWTALILLTLLILPAARRPVHGLPMSRSQTTRDAALLGTGHLPIKEWVHRLRSAGYTGDVAGEWVW